MIQPHNRCSRLNLVAVALACSGMAADHVLAGRVEPVDPALILSTMRESLMRGPVAERVRVSIKPLGKAARSDEFLVKVDPGKKADHSDAAVWIELGELRVFAAAGQLVAVHTGDETSCYSVQFGDRLRPDTLAKLLPPIPMPLVGFILPDDPTAAHHVSTGLTPYTPKITWTAADASGAGPSQVVTLVGAREPFPGERPEPDDTRVTMIVDARTSRPIRFTTFLPDAAELKLEITPTVPGNPATWPIHTEHRTQVASLTDLQPRKGDAAAANVMPELTLLDANWTSWDYRSVFRSPAGAGVPAPTHLAMIFVRESAKDTFGAPSADAKAAEEELRRLEAELNAAPSSKEGAPTMPGLRHVVIPVMLTMDESSRRKVENAVKLREGVGDVGGGNLIWASAPDRTIERFAPGAAAVAVIVRADGSLAGIVLLDGRSKDSKSIREDLRKALGIDQTPPKDPVPGGQPVR